MGMANAPTNNNRDEAETDDDDDDRKFLGVKITKEEHAMFTAQANHTGMSLAAWARAVMRRAAGMPTV